MPGRYRLIRLSATRRHRAAAPYQASKHDRLLFAFAAVAAVTGIIGAVAALITGYEFFALKLPETTKRPVLSMSHVFNRDGSGAQWIQFRVSNEGNKDAAPGFQSHALVPVDAPIEPPKEARKVGVGDKMYFDLTDRPYPYSFHPNAAYQVGSARLKKEERFHVLWYITSATDGTFPGSQKDGTPQYGRIEIEHFPR